MIEPREDENSECYQCEGDCCMCSGDQRDFFEANAADYNDREYYEDKEEHQEIYVEPKQVAECCTKCSRVFDRDKRAFERAENGVLWEVCPRCKEII